MKIIEFLKSAFSDSVQKENQRLIAEIQELRQQKVELNHALYEKTFSEDIQRRTDSELIGQLEKKVVSLSDRIKAMQSDVNSAYQLNDELFKVRQELQQKMSEIEELERFINCLPNEFRAVWVQKKLKDSEQ